LGHTGKHIPKTFEGRIVRTADRIAYINHDIDDAIRAGVLLSSDIPSELLSTFGNRHSERINTLVLDMIEESERRGDIALSSEIAAMFDAFRDFMYDSVYLNMDAKFEESKVYGIIEKIFGHFYEKPSEMPEEYRRIIDTSGIKRAVSDYISGMTDKYAVYMYEKLFIPGAWQIR